MFKKILIASVALYIIVTSTYFIYKYAPYIEQYLKGTQTSSDNNDAKQPEPIVQQKECASYAIGHIAMTEFRVETRFLASASDQDEVFKQGDLQKALATLSCDKAKRTALIYYDSKPVAIASVERFDYSKPLADNSDLKPEFYTVLKVEKKLAEFPTDGYVVAVYDYDESKMDFYGSAEAATDEDEKLIAGSCDTIYYQVVGKDPQKTEIEYAAIKAPLNVAGEKSLSVLASWTDPDLPKDVHYNAVFSLHIKPDGSASRYPLFPITKVRKSSFHLFQVIDLNNDGYKETLVRKNRESTDKFIIYYYDPKKNSYMSEGDQSGE